MKNIFQKLILLLFVISFSIALTLCTEKVSKLYTEIPDTYLSPKYEDESFNDVSIDICYPILDLEKLPPDADTIQIKTLTEFDEAFREYFPYGIKTFSSVTQTGWILYEMKYFGEIIEYQAKTEDSLDFYVQLPDSLIYFQRQSNSDFLFILHFSAVIQSPPNKLNPKSRYSTTLEHEYSIWDRKTGDLVAKDKVTSKMEFDQLAGKWPYRGAVMKTAALIFEKLPMFQK